MRWWKSLLVCALVMIFSCCWTGVARGEAILRFGHPPLTKKMVKAKKKFSPKLKLAKAKSGLGTPYLLNGKAKAPQVVVSVARKKSAGVESGDKHAASLTLKAATSILHLPGGGPQSSEASEIPMAASATALPASVPAPKALWAGMGLIALMAGCKWLARRGSVD